MAASIVPMMTDAVELTVLRHPEASQASGCEPEAAYGKFVTDSDIWQ
jgi:hypothetical protein